MAHITTKFRKYFLHDMNPVIRYLVLSDVFIVGAFGLLSPILAIFVEESVIGGDAAVASVAVAIFLFTKSIFQIPIASFIDRVRGERDDFSFLFWGSLAMSLIPLLYLFVSTPLHLFIVQFILGTVTAFTFPSFMAIFTRHIDNHKEGTEWGVYFTVVDIATAGFAALGGYFALLIGFDFVIILLVALSFIGTLFLWPLHTPMRKR